MTREDHHRLVIEWNETHMTRPEATVSRLVARQADRSPEAVALVCGDMQLTYWELQERTRALAARLRSVGVTSGTLVGVYLDRSIHLPLTLLAILEAWWRRHPLNPAYPHERVVFMARDANLRAVVTEHTRSTLWQAAGVPTILVNDAKDGDSQVEDARDVGLDELAYVIYTSGTKGEPKGVAVAHRSLANHARAMAGLYGLQQSDRVLQLASVSFDVAAEEIFPTWLAGGMVALWPHGVAPSIAELVSFVEEQRLTVLNLPTPLWHQWVDELERGLEARYRPVSAMSWCGTDRVSAEKLARWRALVGNRVRWSNAYGCTEATITSTVDAPTDDDRDGTGVDSVPIGRPIANTRLYVVDGRLELVPIGVPGELVIAGDGVALGYLHRPDRRPSSSSPSAGAARAAGPIAPATWCASAGTASWKCSGASTTR